MYTYQVFTVINIENWRMSLKCLSSQVSFNKLHIAAEQHANNNNANVENGVFVGM